MTKRSPAAPHCRATLSHTVRESHIGAKSKTEKETETKTETAGAGGSPLPQPAEAGAAEGWSPRASLPRRRQRPVPLRGTSELEVGVSHFFTTQRNFIPKRQALMFLTSSDGHTWLKGCRRIHPITKYFFIINNLFSKGGTDLLTSNSTIASLNDSGYIRQRIHLTSHKHIFKSDIGRYKRDTPSSCGVATSRDTYSCRRPLVIDYAWQTDR